MKKIFLLSFITFSLYAQEQVPTAQPGDKPNETSGLSGFTLYFGLDTRSNIKFEGTAGGQPYTSDIDLKSPNFLIGIGYEKMIKPSEDGEWYLGGRITRNFDQDGDKIVETLSGRTTTSNNSVRLRTASMYLTGSYKFKRSDYTYGIGGLFGIDGVSISGLNPNFSYNITKGTSLGVTGSLQRDHIKGEVQIKSTFGEANAQGIGSYSGTNLAGDYSFTSMIFLIGYEF